MKDSGVKGVSIFQLWVHLKDLVHPENHVWICDHRGDKNLISLTTEHVIWSRANKFYRTFLEKKDVDFELKKLMSWLLHSSMVG